MFKARNDCGSFLNTFIKHIHHSELQFIHYATIHQYSTNGSSLQSHYISHSNIVQIPYLSSKHTLVAILSFGLNPFHWSRSTNLGGAFEGYG